MDRIQLLLVSPKPPPNGGIGHWTLLLTGWLKQRADVLMTHVDTAPRWRTIDDLGILKRLVGGCVQGVRDVFLVLLQLVRNRPDVIHLTTSGSLAGVRDVTVLALARLFRTPTLYHIRFGRIPDLEKNGGWEWRILHQAMRLADMIMVIDASTERALKDSLPNGKIVRLPNGIVLKKQERPCSTTANGVRTVLFLGWVIPTKGIRELMDAWKSVRRDGWNLKVVGPGSSEYMNEMAGVVNNMAGVRFEGECSHEQAWKHMLDAEVFVLPSYTEGFPNVVLEAMATQKAILATDVGAIPEMLDAETPEPCGIVVRPRNASALADGLQRLLSDSSLRLELGKRARSKAEREYDAEVVFAEYVKIWRKLSEEHFQKG